MIGNAMRTVRHALGEVEVPSSPQRIVALDELAGIATLALGREPIVVLASADDPPSGEVLRETGLDVREVKLLSLPSNEELRAYEPDLIIGTGPQAPVGRKHDRLSAVAPTAVFDIEGAWRDIIRQTAEVLNAGEVVARQQAAIESQLLAAKGALAPGTTLALMGYTTEPFTVPPHMPSSGLVSEAGFLRPASEQGGADTWWLQLPLESLAEHDADFVVVPDGPHIHAAPIAGHPAFAPLAPKAVHPLSRQWFSNTAFAFWVIASDLRSLAEGGDVLRAEGVGESWSRFLAATSAR